MNRSVLIAMSLASAVTVVVVLLARRALDRPSDDTASDVNEASGAGPFDEATRVTDIPLDAGEGASGTAVGASDGTGSETAAANNGSPDGGSAEPEQEGASSGKTAPDDDEIRRRAELSEAFREALEARDLGFLQELLVSELTEDGTRLGPEDLPTLLRSLVGLEDPGLQKLALTHLERLEGVAPELLRDGYLEYLADAEKPLKFDDVLERLVRVGGDATAQGLVDLLEGGQREPFRRQVVSALGDLGNEHAVPALRDALERDDGRYERDYLDALARIGGREAASLLVDVVSRSKSRDAPSALQNLRGRDVARVLSSRLSSDATESFNREALRKLGELKDPRTIPDVSRFLDRTETSLALEAIVSLSRYDDIRAAQSLESYAARHPDSQYQPYALKYAARVHQRLVESRGEKPASTHERDRDGR